MPISPQLYQELERCIMERMPVRVLKVPEMQLMDQSAIFAYLIDKLSGYDDEFIEDAAASNGTSKEAFVDNTVGLETRYIILSHTWLTNELEVTYEHTFMLQNGRRQIQEGMNGAGFQKLAAFCNIVSTTFLTEFAWMDSICINKFNNSELQYSIPRMFNWYAQSSACVVYLADTTGFDDMASDRWFTRGWTLQELVAPSYVVFYTKTWKPLGEYDKLRMSVEEMEETKVMSVIERATNISAAEIEGFTPGFNGAFAHRMMWLRNRQTQRPEDMVYSILGIFGVRMRINYGEGQERAFFRFLEKILKRPGNYPHSLSILNWAGLPIGDTMEDHIYPSSILPSGPQCYLRHNPELNELIEFTPPNPLKLHLSHSGVRISLLLVLSRLKNTEGFLSDTGPIEFSIAQNTRKEHKIWEDSIFVHLLDNTLRGRVKLVSSNCFVFGVWTFKINDVVVMLPHICSAFLFGLSIKHSEAPISALKFPDALVCAQSKVNTEEVIILKTSNPRLREMKLGKDTIARNYNLRFLENAYI